MSLLGDDKVIGGIYTDLLSQHYQGMEGYLTFGLNSFLLTLLLREFNFLSRGKSCSHECPASILLCDLIQSEFGPFCALAKEIVLPTDHKGLELSLQEALSKLALESGDLSSNFPFLPKPGGLCPGVLTRINLRAEKS